MLGWWLATALLLAGADPFSWYPLDAGRTWIYACEMRGGAPATPEVNRWTATVRVTARIPTSEGFVVERTVALAGTPNPPGGWMWERVPLLVRGACIYPLYQEAWDQRKRSFQPGLRDYLHRVSAMFCFPLRVGATWKAGGDSAWTVEGTGPAARGPQDIPPDAWRLRSHPGSGTTMYVWFQKGIGPVASWSWHNGTYTETFERLRAISSPR